MTRPFAWSYSALKNFETCAKRYLHYNVDKTVVEPESQQLRDGNALHAHFAARLTQRTPLPLGFGQFEGILAALCKTTGTISVEQKLAITADFKPSTFFGKGVWFRTVVDACVVVGANAVVLDWKTGKPSEDDTQLALMAATIFIHQPQVERVKAALMFVNHGQSEVLEYGREQQTEIWNDILPRVRAVEQAQSNREFPPRPSGLCKRYCAVTSCPYHGRGA